MPAFRLSDDNGCPVYKIPHIQSYSHSDLRPIELATGNAIRITFRDPRKKPLTATYLAIVDHPYWKGIVIGLRVEKDGEELPVVLLENIDAITKLTATRP